MTAKRVLICSNFYPPNFVGGAELIAHQYAKCLSRLGHRVVVFAGDAHTPGKRYALWRETCDGIDVRRVRLGHEDFRPEFVNFSHPAVEDRFRALLGEFAPDVVHFHNIVGLSVGLVHVVKAAGVRTVLTLHDHWGFCYRNTLLKPAEDICRDYRKCAECLPVIADGTSRGIPIQLRKDFIAHELELVDVLVSPSRYLAERYAEVGFPYGKVRVIPYGIDVARFSAIRRNGGSRRARFTFVGYFGHHKGIQTVLAALSYLTPWRDRFELNLVGEGELARPLEQQVNEAGWSRWVRFWGKVANERMEEVYGQTDVLLLPSIWPENHPVSIAEAMAAGIPVIATRIGGIPELVEDGETGFLFTPGDPRELAQKMSACVEDRTLAARMGASGFRRIATNTVERRVKEYLELYEGEPTQPAPAGGQRPLVVCVGHRFDLECTAAIEMLLEEAGSPSPRFVMREWISDTMLASATAIWVVDGSTDVEDVIAAAAHGLPLLVPATNEQLKRVCLGGDCGLYYEDADEAAVSLRLLVREPEARRALGKNAWRYAMRH